MTWLKLYRGAKFSFLFLYTYNFFLEMNWNKSNIARRVGEEEKNVEQIEEEWKHNWGMWKRRVITWNCYNPQNCINYQFYSLPHSLHIHIYFSTDPMNTFALKFIKIRFIRYFSLLLWQSFCDCTKKKKFQWINSLLPHFPLPFSPHFPLSPRSST